MLVVLFSAGNILQFKKLEPHGWMDGWMGGWIDE